MYRKTSGSAMSMMLGTISSPMAVVHSKRHSSNISRDACFKPVWGWLPEQWWQMTCTISSQLLVTRQSQSLMNGDGNMMSAANNDYLSGPPPLMQVRLVPSSCTVDARNRGGGGERCMLQGRPSLHNTMPVWGWLPEQWWHRCKPMNCTIMYIDKYW